mmetsp:Transcript_15714/g.41333  ORF Transcript_15714/g.41333 Transcript_15714/m.41333 type:complete len:227 (-) Transcript_15714:310-990(-)
MWKKAAPFKRRDGPMPNASHWPLAARTRRGLPMARWPLPALAQHIPLPLEPLRWPCPILQPHDQHHLEPNIRRARTPRPEDCTPPPRTSPILVPLPLAHPPPRRAHPSALLSLSLARQRRRHLRGAVELPRARAGRRRALGAGGEAEAQVGRVIVLQRQRRHQVPRLEHGRDVLRHVCGEEVERQHVERLLDLYSDVVDAEEQEGRARDRDERLQRVAVETLEHKG